MNYKIPLNDLIAALKQSSKDNKACSVTCSVAAQRLEAIKDFGMQSLNARQYDGKKCAFGDTELRELLS